MGINPSGHNEAGTETVQLRDVTTTINGVEWSGRVAIEEVLLDLLRTRIRLTGTKRSCESAVCGACTVLVDGQPISSCAFLAFEIDGRSVVTIEGVGSDAGLDPLQEAFVRNLGAQCGYCTPGQIMSAKGLLLRSPTPTDEEIREWMSGNICRCGCYSAIATSIREASDASTERG